MNDSDTSHLLKGSWLAKVGLSVRGIVVIMLTLCLCIMSVMQRNIQQELFWLASAALGYYFGQQHNTEKKP